MNHEKLPDEINRQSGKTISKICTIFFSNDSSERQSFIPPTVIITTGYNFIPKNQNRFLCAVIV